MAVMLQRFKATLSFHHRGSGTAELKHKAFLGFNLKRSFLFLCVLCGSSERSERVVEVLFSFDVN